MPKKTKLNTDLEGDTPVIVEESTHDIQEQSVSYDMGKIHVSEGSDENGTQEEEEYETSKKKLFASNAEEDDFVGDWVDESMDEATDDFLDMAEDYDMDNPAEEDY